MGYETSSTADEALQLGSAVSAKIEITLKKIDELFENTEIPVEIGLKLPSGKYEYIPLGFLQQSTHKVIRQQRHLQHMTE